MLISWCVFIKRCHIHFWWFVLQAQERGDGGNQPPQQALHTSSRVLAPPGGKSSGPLWWREIESKLVRTGPIQYSKQGFGSLVLPWLDNQSWGISSLNLSEICFFNILCIKKAVNFVIRTNPEVYMPFIITLACIIIIFERLMRLYVGIFY